MTDDLRTVRLPTTAREPFKRVSIAAHGSVVFDAHRDSPIPASAGGKTIPKAALEACREVLGPDRVDALLRQAARAEGIEKLDLAKPPAALYDVIRDRAMALAPCCEKKLRLTDREAQSMAAEGFEVEGVESWEQKRRRLASRSPKTTKTEPPTETKTESPPESKTTKTEPPAETKE